MRHSAIHSDIVRYIIEQGYKPGDKLPTIQQISQELEMSVAKARESLEVARALSMVEIKPGRGMRVTPFEFTPAVSLTALYAIGQDRAHFEDLRQMRNALERSFWMEAVEQLTDEDIAQLNELIDRAVNLLSKRPIQVPAREHRQFHLTIFSRLENPFVNGVLEAYWEAYEAFGLNLYVSLEYHRNVWQYHRSIVKAIEDGDPAEGLRLLVEHMNLLRHRDGEITP